MDRVRANLIQYGIIASNPAKATVEQTAFESKFAERVTGVKGKSLMALTL